MSTTLDRAARAIERIWRGIWPADAHRMAVTLKRNGLLIPEVPTPPNAGSSAFEEQA